MEGLQWESSVPRLGLVRAAPSFEPVDRRFAPQSRRILPMNSTNPPVGIGADLGGPLTPSIYEFFSFPFEPLRRERF